MLYQTLVQSITLYNAETGTLKEECKKKLKVFKMPELQRILTVSLRERRRNVDIKNELDIKLSIGDNTENKGVLR